MKYYRLDVNPEPWAIGSVQIGRRQGNLTGGVGRNQQLYNYQEAVRDLLGAQSPDLVEPPIALEFYFWRQIESYKTDHSRRQRKHEADDTNLQKATEDALQGILFSNDRDVVSVHSELVAQGPDVDGLVIVGVEHRLPISVDLLPNEVYELFTGDHEEQLPFGDNVNRPPF